MPEVCGGGATQILPYDTTPQNPYASRGLEQETALPRDSYLQPYYADVYGQLRVGPPLLFVLRGLNLSAGAPDVDAVCSTSGCDDDSFLNQVRPSSSLPCTAA